ncbi:peptidoglycan DD-metalloendopeptidase family protein [Thalassolituus sp. LLYu03]|uniref:peptidoglycan DD-metalloendopeptidase family protein n=1 Tax=Thalassolituus sp. LLYu03 TaxID=3421656 RepID=UPI003D268451
MFELVNGMMNFMVSLFAAGSLHTAAPASADALPIPHQVPGGIALVNAGYGINPPKVTFNNQPVMVVRTDPQKPWTAIVGIPLSQKAGDATVKTGSRKTQIHISEQDYPEQHLTVSKNQVNPSKEELERINREAAQMNTIYKSFTPGKGWSPMAWPVAGPLSSQFGLRRFFNGEERNPHSGLDIAVPTGTPVMAPADGKVVLTGDFFFNGNAVFIDHGQGLISMFCHLSSIEVKEGETISAGDRLGLSGATGRATGPHLHWTISLNNARINPLLMLSPWQAPGIDDLTNTQPNGDES